MGSFLGIPMSQYWSDLFAWEDFFTRYRPATFIELGTGDGGMALFFALQCYQRDILFHTYDNQQWLDFDAHVARLLSLHRSFHHIDIFSDEGRQDVIRHILHAPKPIAIFFDNGDKPREWALFAPLLSPGDFCAVHDWDVEFCAADIGPVSVERIALQGYDEARNGLKTMWFRRTGG